MKLKRGRPFKAKEERRVALCVRIPYVLLEKLKLRARSYGISLTEVVEYRLDV